MQKVNSKELCNILGIANITLANWYKWEKNSLENGELTKPVLPVPSRDITLSGKPRYWTETQLNELIEFKKQIIKGRSGTMSKYKKK